MDKPNVFEADFTIHDSFIPRHHSLSTRLLFDFDHPNIDIFIQRLWITPDGKKLMISYSSGVKEDLLKYFNE